MSGDGDTSKKVLDGIQLILTEMRDIKVETRDLRADFMESVRKSDEKFAYLIKRSDEDRHRADEDRRDSDARFDRQMRAVVQVGRRIIRTQEEHTKLLQSILKSLRAGRNGSGGNGSH